MTISLSREIVVNYDQDLYPTTIQQTWKDGNGADTDTTHTWASFSYTTKTVATDFDSGLTVIGPPNSTVIKVLDKVTFPDGSYTKFHHNGYIQVFKIENFAPNNDLLNHVRTNLESPTANQTDVPRFTETRSFVQNFNGGNETVFTNTFQTGHTPTDLDGNTVNATLIQTALTDHPNGNVTNTYVGQSGWIEGLPIRTDDYADGNYSTPKRSSWTKWTQDDVNATDVFNPRVIATKVGDGINLRRSEIDYLLYESTSIAKFGLVEETRTYAADQSTVLKRSEIEYNWFSAYTDRRIIGLPTEIRSYGWNDISNSLELGTRLTYAYDEEDFTQESNQIISPIRHDTTNFGSSFVVGRGNLTSVTRHDVTAQTASVTSKTRFDIAGSVVSKLDPLNRKVRIEYSDVFNDTGTSRNTFAYPTKIYDPANNFSEVKYRFDIGANVWAGSPAPAGNSVGKQTERLFDNKGRLEKEIILNNGAYTRYEYPNNGIQSKVFSTIIDTNNNGADAADEVLTESWSDGAGRVRLSRSPHTFDGSGNAASWAGVIIEYDLAGRPARQTVPTETDSNWVPIYDDYRGMNGSDYIRLWTVQKYDWMGRVVRKINTDGEDTVDGGGQPILNDSDVLISYAGCGCAGGLVTTVQSEAVQRDDYPNLTARRVKKIHADILGRTQKTESFGWDGSTVYSTLVNKYDERDQVILGKQFAGTVSSETFQETVVEFDGFGRVKKTRKPGQDDESFITYNYNVDDSISSVEDGRGATTTNTYNSLGLLTQRSSTMPGINPDPALSTSVSFEYDDLGNRTLMTDTEGLVEYEYNELGQLEAEERKFDDSMLNAPVSGNRFRLEYSYTLAGQLESYSDPFGQQIEYTFDKSGKVIDVTGSSFGGVTDYSRDAAYRAWGNLKSVTAGSGMQLGITYNNRLRTSGYNVEDASQNAIMEKSYSYQTDGKLSYLQDHVNPRFDRLNTYDHAGRIKTGKSGEEARGGTVDQEDMKDDLPYRQSYQFNQFDDLTSSTNLHWGETSWVGQNFATSHTYANNRIQQYGWEYDEDGRNTANTRGTDFANTTFNAAGKRARTLTTYSDVKSFYDGNGAEIKRERLNWDEEESEWVEQPTKYYVRSSVIGDVVSEVWANGKKHRSYVKGIGNQTAIQSAYAFETATLNELVLFEFTDPSGMSYRTTNKLGQAAVYGDGGEGSPIETDPLGGNVGTYTPFIILTVPYDPEYPETQPYTPGGVGGPSFSSLYATFGSRIADLPGFGTMWGSFGQLDMVLYEESVANARSGFGFITHERRLELEAVVARLGSQLRAIGLQVHQAGFTLHVQGRLNLEGGDVTGDEIVGGNWVDTSTSSVDLDNNIVTINVDGYYDFGEGAFDQTQTQQGSVPMSEDDMEDLRSKALVNLTQKCAAFIEKLAAEVLGRNFDDKTGEPLLAEDILGEAFDRVKNSPRDLGGELRGFTWGWTRKGSGGMAGYGKIGKENENVAQIQYRSGSKPGPLSIRHELLHVALRSDDMQLSDVVRRLGIPVYTDFKTLLNYPTDPDNENLAYSGYWGQALKNHCPDPLPNR